MKLYIQRNSQGHVLVARWVADDVQLESPFELQTPEVAQAWALERGAPDPVARAQDTDIILQRLTEAERSALFTARRTVWQLDYMMTRAASTGRISEADADFAAGRAMLDQLGIIAAARWDELFVAASQL